MSSSPLQFVNAVTSPLLFLAEPLRQFQQAQAPDRCHHGPAAPRPCAPSCWRAPPPRPLGPTSHRATGPINIPTLKNAIGPRARTGTTPLAAPRQSLEPLPRQEFAIVLRCR